MNTILSCIPRFSFLIVLAGVPYNCLLSQILQGTATYLNSGSRPAAGVDISAFGAGTVPTTDAGMFILKFPDKKPGDKVKIIVGSKDKTGTELELVNDKVISQVRIPSKPDDDIIEIVVCKVGQRNDAALRYNGIIVKTINEATEKRLQEIDKKLGAVKIDAETITALQNEKDHLAAERDSALAKAEEQALFMASINLDKANQLVKEAMAKVDSMQDISGAIAVLDNEILYQSYLSMSDKRKKASAEIKQVLAGFEFKINLLLPLYRFNEVAECYEKIAGIYEREGYEQADCASVYQKVSNNWDQYGDYRKALEFSLKTVAIREKILPQEHRDLAIAYSNLANTYDNLSDNDKALEYHMKALAIFEKLQPAEQKNQAATYNNIALTYSDYGDYAKALEFSLKAVSILEKILPDEDHELAICYDNLSESFLEAGDLQHALAYNLKALGINEKVLPADHPSLAMTYNHLGQTYQALGEYEKSLEYNLKALVIREKVLPLHHPDLAMTYNNVSLAYENLGDYQKALETIDKAISIMEQVMPADHPDLQTMYDNKANAYEGLGDFQKSLEYHLKAAAIAEKVLPADHPSLASSYNGLLLIYRKLGEQEKALEYSQKAITIQEKTLPADHPDLAVSYNNIALIYGDLGDYQKSVEANVKSIAMMEKVLPADHPNLAMSYGNLAQTYSDLGDYPKSVEYQIKVITIYEKILPPGHPDLCIPYNNIGRCYRETGDFKKAIEFGLKAVQQGEVSDPKPVYLNKMYGNLGRSYLYAKQFPEAKAAFEKRESLQADAGAYQDWTLFYALQNDNTHAIERLKKAVSLGFKDLKWLTTNERLASIRGEQGYKDIVEQLQQK